MVTQYSGLEIDIYKIGFQLIDLRVEFAQEIKCPGFDFRMLRHECSLPRSLILGRNVHPVLPGSQWWLD